jgi:hypothetical protein
MTFDDDGNVKIGNISQNMWTGEWSGDTDFGLGDKQELFDAKLIDVGLEWGPSGSVNTGGGAELSIQTSFYANFKLPTGRLNWLPDVGCGFSKEIHKRTIYEKK